LALSQLLTESLQDMSTMGRAQRFQADRDDILTDVKVPRGLKDLSVLEFVLLHGLIVASYGHTIGFDQETRT